MSAPSPELVTTIRQALEAARAAGQPPPGRPTLVHLTGATDHAVRKALAELATEDASSGDTLASPPPATPPTQTSDGRFVAWAGFVFGSVMSIAANVLQTWLPAEHQPPGWSPGLAPQIGAAVWPIGFLLSVEVLSRIRWPRGWQWTLARFAGTGTVALGSAAISYGHLRSLLLAWHTAQWLPLSDRSYSTVL
ncbi:hypothetical protein [Actinosynnema sp. NPDC023587]|uniref:hypothetical protein n=1 Tax=Actinosynnema sp. NPDC023587 TaxID=3154695 RepID=UPI0033FF97A3